MAPKVLLPQILLNQSHTALFSALALPNTITTFKHSSRYTGRNTGFSMLPEDTWTHGLEESGIDPLPKYDMKQFSEEMLNVPVA